MDNINIKNNKKGYFKNELLTSVIIFLFISQIITVILLITESYYLKNINNEYNNLRIEINNIKAAVLNSYNQNYYDLHTNSTLSGSAGHRILKREKRHRKNKVESARHELVESVESRPQRHHRNNVAAHFHAESSHYRNGYHEHYLGNGHLRHPEGIFRDWAPSSWMEKLGMDNHFKLEDGAAVIKHNGLYFIYAQIHYLDQHNINGYSLFKNDQQLFQCTSTSYSESSVEKSNSCFTAGITYLTSGDRISIKDLGSMRFSLFTPTRSFFGFIKLNDAKLN